MTTQLPPSRAVAAAFTGIVTAAYYATPDLLPSRRARGWAKAGLTAVALAASVPELRSARAAWEQPDPDGGSAADVLGSLPAGKKAVLAGTAAAGIAAASVLVAAGERWVFRHGQARAAAGRRLPHTGPALLYGAASAALWFLPTPGEPQPTAR